VATATKDSDVFGRIIERVAVDVVAISSSLAADFAEAQLEATACPAAA
jgi:hypothetical protein